jgi:hypothetical protein
MAVYGIAWEYRIGGGVPDIRNFPEGDSETWNVFNNDLQGLVPVIYDISEDGIVTCATDMVAMLGLACADATGTSDTDIPVMMVTTSDVFSATASTDGANATTAHTLDMVGLNYGLIPSTESGETDKWTVNTNETSNSAVTQIDRHPQDSWGTSGGRILFRFMNKVLEDGSQA